MKTLFLLGIAAFVTLVVAGPAEAQTCNERCVQVYDNSNPPQPTGWGCSIGGTNKFCSATVTQCTITMCGGSGGEKKYTSLVLPDGRVLAVMNRCDLKGERSLGALMIALAGTAEGDQLARGVALARGEENRRAYAIAAM